MRKFQSIEIVKDLLPALDDIDRTLNSNELTDSKSLLEAIGMIKSKIDNVLKKHFVESFDSIETKFDPMLHEALLEQSSNLHEKGKIIEEYERGYKYHDKIIRHAKVIVSKGEEKGK